MGGDRTNVRRIPGRRLRTSLALLFALALPSASSAAIAADHGGTPSGGRTAEFCAVVETTPPSGPVGEWRASGVTVHVSATTVVEAAQADPARGVAVLVAGELLRDGSVQATRIVLRAAGCPVHWPRHADLAVASAGGEPPTRGRSETGRVDPDAIAIGVLGGAQAAAGVVVATVREGAGALAVTATGLRPNGRYALMVDGAATVEVLASESGALNVDLAGASAAAPDRRTLPITAARRVEVVDGAGAVAMAGELRAVTAARDGSTRAGR